MDTFTQAALGATIAQAGFGKQLGRRAVWIGAVCGALPDADIISAAFGPWASMVHHRGMTHSLIFAAVAAPLLGWIAWRWLDRGDLAASSAAGDSAPPGSLTAGRGTRSGTKWQWTQLAFWALVTHPLLDIFTSYGTQFLWPFSDHRLALDAIPIIDPIYTLTLIGALILGRVYRKRAKVGRWVATAALVVTTGYLGLGYVESQQAQRLAAEQLRDQGFEPVHLRAQPSMLVWMWRVVARNANGDLRIGVVSSYAPTPMTFVSVDRPDEPLVERALDSPQGRLLQWFSDGMIGARLERRGEATRVVLEDQRYGSVIEPATAFWGAHADFDGAGKLVTMDRYRNHRPGRIGAMVAASWSMMWNGVEPPSREGPEVSGVADDAPSPSPRE
ncbi:MAG: metal-dependent hydrolase [Deltaproteobacteria bacterium]|nr:metal-dependent hydrolase [Deltaproteobacteria bacterium]